MKKKDKKPVKVNGQQVFFNRPFMGGFGAQQQQQQQMLGMGRFGGFGAQQQQMLGGMGGFGAQQQQQQQMLAARRGFGSPFGPRFF